MSRGNDASAGRFTAGRVLDYMRRADYRPLTQRQLLHRMNVPGDRRGEARAVLQDLLDQGRVVKLRGGLLAARGGGEVATGTLQRHRSGFGFVTPDGGGPDVFVPPDRMGDLITGDRVRFREGGGRAGRTSAIVLGTEARRSRRVLGVLRARGRGGEFRPFEPGLPSPVAVPGAFRHGARDGEVVEVELLSGRDGRELAGKVLETLGLAGEQGVDELAVARMHGLVMRFPEDVRDEARELPSRIGPGAKRERERFDDPAPVTIDGETARDFDDAVAVEPRGKDGFRLYVHIADVGHFVAPGGPLDREALRRGTSVYFPGRVLPMFPERLSDDLCSLRPGVDRLVQSVILDLDREANVTGIRFADGVIRSAARLTYTQVARVIDGESRVRGVRPALGPMILLADRLRRLLEAKRAERGGIDVDLPEPRILLDVEGAMTGIRIEPRNRAHRMIEEFMILANEVVARHLERKRAPCLYRVHEAPDAAKIEVLRQFLRGFGLGGRLRGTRIEPAAIRALLGEVEGRPEARVVGMAVLRSMKQARYLPRNDGHFGLALDSYAHFTSPIRRYPDLVVHRLLRATRRGQRDTVSAAWLEETGEHCSRAERNAEAAERELLAWKKVAFIRDRVGETFRGVVSGVAPFGVFVQLEDNLVEGLVRVEALGSDAFRYSEQRLELRGQRSGIRYRLGDRLNVRVARVDPVLRRVDLEPTGG